MTGTTKVVPRHLGLIIDGNRRWARARGLPVSEGHRRGYENVKTIVKAAQARGVQYFSVYVFSTENWKRERTEVRDLMKLLFWVLKHEVRQLNKDGVRVRVLGSKLKLGKELLALDLQQEGPGGFARARGTGIQDGDPTFPLGIQKTVPRNDLFRPDQC